MGLTFRGLSLPQVGENDLHCFVRLQTFVNLDVFKNIYFQITDS